MDWLLIIGGAYLAYKILHKKPQDKTDSNNKTHKPFVMSNGQTLEEWVKEHPIQVYD